MQNIIRISGKIMLLTCLSLMLLTSCSQKSKLKLAIEVAGKQCPISVGVAGEVTSIDFDGADVVYSMSMNEDYINLEALGKTPDTMKSGVSAMFNNPKGEIKKMLELVVASQSGIKFIYKGKTTGKEVECYLNTEDLKKILDQDMSQEESDRQKLEELVKVTNVSCPMKVDEATTLDKLTIESDNVVYNYTIDEEAVDLNVLKGNEGQMKQNIKGSLNISEPAIKMFLEACIKDNKRLIYRYKGDISGQIMECIFEVSEIKALF